MLRRLRIAAVCAAALAVVGVCVAWANGTEPTLGQIGADTPCDTPADFVAAQTATSGGVSYTVPSGQWKITSWSAAGGSSGEAALVVFRPTDTPDEYEVVGSTRARELSNPKNAFSARIKVKDGDLIGFWVEAGTTCALHTGSTSDTARIFFPTGIPVAGTRMTLVPGLAVGYRLNMKVSLTSRSTSP